MFLCFTLNVVILNIDKFLLGCCIYIILATTDNIICIIFLLTVQSVPLSHKANFPQTCMTSESFLESTSNMTQGRNYSQSQYNFIVIEVSSGTSKNNPSTCRVSLSIKIAGILTQGRKDCFSVKGRRLQLRAER